MSTALIILGVVFGFGFLGAWISDKNKESKCEEENLYTLDSYDYCGGNDYVAKDTKVDLKWGKDNVLVINYRWAGRVEYIPFSDVNGVYCKTEHQIKEDVTLTRLAVMGLFAFGNKKETTSNAYYMILCYKNNEGREQNVILSGGSLQENLNLYNKILNDYRTSQEIKNEV